MTNKEVWQHYAEYTDRVTSVARKLGFAAVAVIWVIGGRNVNIEGLLRYSLFIIAVFFVIDLLQFFVGSLILRFWIRKQEKQFHRKDSTIEGDYQKPSWIDTPTFILWLLKIITLLICYILIGLSLFK